MNVSNHPEVQTRPVFRVMAGFLSLLSFATAPVWIYFGIIEGAWFAWVGWMFGLITFFAAVGFAGGALTGYWFKLRRRNLNITT